MTRIKICGITNYDDAALAADLGAHALGFIFASSPRKIAPDKAREIIRNLPPFVKSVGVFVNEDTEKIIETVRYCCLDTVQLHGDETPEICESLMPRAIKALRIKDDSRTEEYKPYTGKIRAFLLDTYSKGVAGGTGKTFNWDIAVNMKALGTPIILAGGITPSNINEAIEKVKPYAVDISSGIEEKPGKKDHRLMIDLFEKLKKQGIGK
jgi:phosphoribosylanthranilate isomerase